jgi:hypothetical protein
MADILPPAPIGSPFASYNWDDWYRKVRDAINNASEIDWNIIINKPTTLTGYGITDATPATRTISTTAPLSGGGDLTANRTLTVSTFGSGNSGVVPASGGGILNYLRADGTWDDPLNKGTVVTGSRSGNVALANLLIALEALGIITDSTT